MITFLSRLGERLMDIATGRKIEFLLQEVQALMTQNEEVRALVDQLGGDVAEANRRLAGVSGDVSYLKAKIDALPVGEPLDEATLADLRSAVAGVATVTDGLATLDESTTPDDGPPVEPTP